VGGEVHNYSALPWTPTALPARTCGAWADRAYGGTETTSWQVTPRRAGANRRHLFIVPCPPQALPQPGVGNAKQPGPPFSFHEDGQAGRVDVAYQREVENELAGGGAKSTEQLFAHCRCARGIEAAAKDRGQRRLHATCAVTTARVHGVVSLPEPSRLASRERIAAS
jgi:hypothetical protein